MLTYGASMLTIIKLVSGTEIIGEVAEETKGTLTVKNPLSINYKFKNELAPPIIALSRYVSFSFDEVVEFKKEHVVSAVKPIESMKKYYNVSLKNIREHIDPNIDQELAAAAGEEEDVSSESQAKLALIERHVTKATLN